MVANEPFIELSKLRDILKKIDLSIKNNDDDALVRILKKFISNDINKT